MSEVLCRCGCGKALTPYQISKKGKYATKACEARWRRHNSVKYRLYARPENKYSYLGENVCKEYNDNNIECVMCYEQELFQSRKCWRSPRKK